jgi:GTPase SAR1 family protein
MQRTIEGLWAFYWCTMSLTDGHLIVLSSCAKLSKDIRTWFQNVEQHATEGVHKILIGNKCDWEEKRAVETKEGVQLADELGIPFIETSAKSNINVEKAFYQLAQYFLLLHV